MHFWLAYFMGLFFSLQLFCLQEGNLLHMCKNADTAALNFMALIFLLLLFVPFT